MQGERASCDQDSPTPLSSILTPWRPAITSTVLPIVLVENDSASCVYDVRTRRLGRLRGFDDAVPVVNLDVVVGGGEHEWEKCEWSETHEADGVGCYVFYMAP